MYLVKGQEPRLLSLRLGSATYERQGTPAPILLMNQLYSPGQELFASPVGRPWPGE